MLRYHLGRFLCLTLLSFDPMVSPAANQVIAGQLMTGRLTSSGDASATSNKFPFPEKLDYRVEWRLITAGAATLRLTRSNRENWQTTLDIESAGIIARLYSVQDKYKVASDSKFCMESSDLDAQENKRHIVSHTIVEDAQHMLRHEEKDLVKNTATQKEFDVPPCTREIAGALASLRLLNLEPGKAIAIPITDGKKLVNARIESQARETLNFEDKRYPTIRYEAFLFDNHLYRRKGRLFVWISDDEDRIPVQIRIQLGFPIGNVTIQLVKHERMPG